MAYFEWSPDIALGHGEIDAQHQRLLELAEAVVEPLFSSREHRPAIEPLAALIDFARAHFAFEENLMRERGYPDVDNHARFHGSLLAELDGSLTKVRAGSHTTPAGLISFLWNWLVLHVDGTDRPLVEWLSQR